MRDKANARLYSCTATKCRGKFEHALLIGNRYNGNSIENSPLKNNVKTFAFIANSRDYNSN